MEKKQRMKLRHWQMWERREGRGQTKQQRAKRDRSTSGDQDSEKKKRHTKGVRVEKEHSWIRNQPFSPMSGVTEGNTRSKTVRNRTPSYCCSMSPSTPGAQMKQKRERVCVFFFTFLAPGYITFSAMCTHILYTHTHTHTAAFTTLQPVCFKHGGKKVCHQIKREGCVFGLLISSCVVRHTHL